MTSPVAVRTLVTAVLVAAVLAVCSFLPYELPVMDALKRPGELPYAPLGPLYGRVPVVQEFVAEAPGLDAVELQLATHRRRNRGLLTLSISKLVEGRWRELASVTTAKRDIDDNAYHRFEFSQTLRVGRGNRVAFTLTVNGGASSAVSLYYTPGWHLEGSVLRLGDHTVDGTAHFQPLYRNRGRLGDLGWWGRLTILLGPGASAALALSLLVALGLFLHLSVWRVGPASQADAPDPDL